jgi:hypothetical protein
MKPDRPILSPLPRGQTLLGWSQRGEAMLPMRGLWQAVLLLGVFCPFCSSRRISWIWPAKRQALFL